LLRLYALKIVTSGELEWRGEGMTKLIIAGLVFLACGLPLGTVRAESSKSCKVGVLLPLTGALAEYGAAFRNGWSLAENEDRSPKASVISVFEDTRYEGKAAISAFRAMMEGGPPAAAVCWGFAPTESVAPLAERMSLPLVAVGDSSSAKNRKFVVNFINPPSDFAQPVAEYLNDPGFKRVAVVKTEMLYLNTLLDALRSKLLEPGKISSVLEVSPGEKDFKTIIAKVREAGYDSLGVFLLGGQIQLFYRQLQQQQLHVRTFGTDFFAGAAEIRASGSAIEGAVFGDNLVSQQFRERYIREFGDDAQAATAARGFEIARLLLDILGTDSCSGGERLMGALRATGHRASVLGDLNFHDSAAAGQYIGAPTVLMRIKAGRLEAVSKAAEALFR
jgi:branched-chain amino acid transport system substrate-binding protein